MKESAAITIPSSPRYLSVVRTVTASMADFFGMTEREREDIRLAVDEACSNVIKHAYQGNSNRRIVVKYFLSDSFEVVIEDSGLKARPETIKGRSLDDVRPGGLGIHFIRRIFDVCEFDPEKKRGNRLRLIRYRSEGHENCNKRG